MKVNLLKAMGKDALEMIEFEKASSSKYFHAFTDEVKMGEYLQDSSVFFILADNVKVGAIGFEKKSDTLAQVQGLNILPEMRGKGIGYLSVLEIMKKIRNEGFMEANLAVHPENSIGIATYKKAGFQVGDIVENFFGDGEPRIIMNYCFDS